MTFAIIERERDNNKSVSFYQIEFHVKMLDMNEESGNGLILNQGKETVLKIIRPKVIEVHLNSYCFLLVNSNCPGRFCVFEKI